MHSLLVSHGSVYLLLRICSSLLPPIPRVRRNFCSPMRIVLASSYIHRVFLPSFGDAARGVWTVNSSMVLPAYFANMGIPTHWSCAFSLLIIVTEITYLLLPIFCSRSPALSSGRHLFIFIHFAGFVLINQFINVQALTLLKLAVSIPFAKGWSDRVLQWVYFPTTAG